MSWIKEMAGGEAMPPYVETDSPSNPKVKDPSIPNRMVSTKPANRPFLAYVLIPNFTFQMQTQINWTLAQSQGISRETGGVACWVA